MGVLVIGMHRSGTSAMAGALRSLGLHGGVEEDLIGPSVANRRGHHELRSLVFKDEMILRTFGGAWSDPPPFDPEALAALTTTTIGSASRDLLVRALPPGRPWVCKDPRLSLLLPFWLRVITEPVAVVLMFRSPGDVVRSLGRRNGFSAEHGLRLWSHYNLAACHSLRGVPCHVVHYDDLVRRPRHTLSTVADLLARVGVGPLAPDLDAAVESIAPAPSEAPPPGIPSAPEVRDLYALLLDVQGPWPQGLTERLPVLDDPRPGVG